MDFVQLLQRMHVLPELGDKTREIVDAVQHGHGVGELTLKVKFKLRRNGRRNYRGEPIDAVPEIDINPHVSAKVPEPDYDGISLFVGDDAELMADHPRQPAFEFERPRDASAASGVERRAIND